MKAMFGARVKEARLQESLTQTQLAYHVGKHPTWISQLERGRRLPSVKNLVKLARILRVSTDYLLGVDTNE